MSQTSVSLTWLGHATFKVVSVRGKRIIIDPWIMGNPACPQELKQVDGVDILLCTHGHFDHIGDAVEVARRHKPKVVGIFELCHWMGRKGVENTFAMNKGGTVELDGIRVTMVHADHSCGILEDDGTIVYGGEGVGYVVQFENGLRLYHAGDTAVFGDMKLIGELYRPDVALLPIGDLYTMSPREAAYAIRLLGVRRVVPMHFGTFPALTGSPDALKEATSDIEGLEILTLKPGETITLS